MKLSTKVLAALATASVGTVGGFVGVCKYTSEVLTTRKNKLYEKIVRKPLKEDPFKLMEIRDKYMAWVEEYGYEKHEIYTSTGDRLQGYLLKAKVPTDRYIFGAHGYRCNAKIEFCLFANYYINKGVNVFIVDHRGAGESEGDYIGFGTHEAQDALKWLEYMKKTFGENIKIGLHGVSMGAATVMRMSGDEKLIDNVKFVVSDCGYTNARSLFDEKMQGLGALAKPFVDTVDHFNKARAKYSFSDADVTLSLQNTHLPFLFIHGDEDALIPVKASEENFANCASLDKELFIVKGSGHAQNIVVDGYAYMGKVFALVDKYM